MTHILQPENVINFQKCNLVKIRLNVSVTKPFWNFFILLLLVSDSMLLSQKLASSGKSTNKKKIKMKNFINITQGRHLKKQKPFLNGYYDLRHFYKVRFFIWISVFFDVITETHSKAPSCEIIKKPNPYLLKYVTFILKTKFPYYVGRVNISHFAQRQSRGWRHHLSRRNYDVTWLCVLCHQPTTVGWIILQKVRVAAEFNHSCEREAIPNRKHFFKLLLVTLHFTPVSGLVIGWVGRSFELA